jgi:hypothetical protein
MSSHGEKVLVVEIVASQVIITVRELSKGQAPKPSQYIASLIVFGTLGGIAIFGDDWAKFAAGLGGLVLLSTIVEGAGGWTNSATPTNLLNIVSKVPGTLSGKPSNAPPGAAQAQNIQQFAQALNAAPGGTHQPS